MFKVEAGYGAVLQDAYAGDGRHCVASALLKEIAMIRIVSETGDDSRSPPQEGHGRAALLLVESLIHGLTSRAVLTVAEAIEIIDVAAEVEDEHRVASAEAGLAPVPSLLSPLATSLRYEVGL